MQQVEDFSVTHQLDDGGTVEKMLFTYSEDEKQENEMNKSNAQLPFSPRFIPFYPKLLEKGLSMLEALIFGFIDFYLGNTRGGRFYFSNKQVASLFGVGEQHISNSIKALKDKGVIIAKYKLKANGGKLRFIELCDYNYNYSPNITGVIVDYKNNYSPNISRVIDNNNKINNNKIKEVSKFTSEVDFSEKNCPEKGEGVLDNFSENNLGFDVEASQLLTFQKINEKYAKEKIALWFGKTLLKKRIIKPDMWIKKITKLLETGVTFQDIIEAMWRNEHNRRASGKEALSKYTGKPWHWSLEYLFGNYKGKSPIENSLNREMDIKPSEENMALLQKVIHLVPNAKKRNATSCSGNQTSEQAEQVDRDAQKRRLQEYLG